MRKEFEGKNVRPHYTPEPISRYALAQTELVHTYDETLPPSVGLREFIHKGEFSTTHTVILVEEEYPDTQLGYMILQELYSNQMWWLYMRHHSIESLWVDRADLVSLISNRGIGTALWNVSNKIIKPKSSRAIIDTSENEWTKRKIIQAKNEKIFEIVDQDMVLNSGIPHERFLVQYL